jgi:RIO kinase 1
MQEFHGARSVLDEAERAQSLADCKPSRAKGKDARATVDQVLDPRTLRILSRFLREEDGILSSLHGCISAGKEANVYEAVGSNGVDYAVKVYRTSILGFRDRDRYVIGERRFEHGYCSSNPRKMVRLWAEKEMRNLKRLATTQVPCPEVVEFKDHVLVMTMIGRDGIPAPKLKQAVDILGLEEVFDAYVQVCVIMWVMANQCKLVHADLSEYNLLYMDETVFVIDVSQSVEFDHPNALEFLREDCLHIVSFFRKFCDNILGTEQLFQFVMNSCLSRETLKESLLSIEPVSGEAAVEIARVPIPRCLDDVMLVIEEPTLICA